ncbi:MAG: hypothetical protein JAY74_19070 [Candidatus Thiodiazotropha taylori]|nr:hypothetical protein [Candidatus Thiodiazotropha taylori]
MIWYVFVFNDKGDNGFSIRLVELCQFATLLIFEGPLSASEEIGLGFCLGDSPRFEFFDVLITCLQRAI